MPRASRLRLVLTRPSTKTPGRRLARVRRERGITRIELTEKTGLVQTLVSGYERGKLRLMPT
jgi:transcriptional regulator with XRE-family HTH domain